MLGAGIDRDFTGVMLHTVYEPIYPSHTYPTLELGVDDEVIMSVPGVSRAVLSRFYASTRDDENAVEQQKHEAAVSFSRSIVSAQF